MYDYHMHSNFSMDSAVNSEDMVKAAKKKGLKAICITDHIDLEVNGGKHDIIFNLNDYFKEINRLKYSYNDDIEVLAGAEFGMQDKLEKRYEDIAKRYPFDYIIMSIHSFDGCSIFSQEELLDESSVCGQKIYYEHMLKCMENYKEYDALGHIDYIARYYAYKGKELEFTDEIRDIVAEILKRAIEDEKAIEVNSASLRYGMSDFHPKREILRLYKDLGGELVTTGSDAHKVEDVGYEIRNEEKILKELGFKYMYIYRKRKAYPIHL